jgi:hypothetical protein
MIQKPIYSGLLHTGLPDLQALYGMAKIPPVQRASFAGWTDKYALPSEAWFDNVAANVQSTCGIIQVDHEDWPYATTAERRATAGKYLYLYAGIKSRRPDLRIGWYMDPIRRDYWRSTKRQGQVNFDAWKAENDDMAAIMAPVTDVYMPSLYFFYTRDTASGDCDYAGMYLEANIAEAKRARDTYGRPGCPIYPYVWFRKHLNTRDLDQDIWELTLRTVMEQADGLVAWGGWQQLWDENALWWQALKARLTDKRRTV